jgi:5'-phosphate synthase pdxT subunit
MKVGVLNIQGDVSEHYYMIENLIGKGNSILVKKESDLELVNALIIPGGESTTISNLMVQSGLFDKVKKLGEEGFPIFGTCAGLILLAKEGDEQVSRTKTKLLGLMDMKIKRNAFGRQRESFETNISIDGIKGNEFPCVFIRSPAITKVYGKCKVLGKFGDHIIAAQQDNLLATAFHPELTEDRRMHEYFFSLI